MTITVRTTKAGNYIVEMDAFDKIWNATVAGATVAKVMLPASVELQECEDGHFGQHPEFGTYHSEAELVHMAAHGDIRGARVYEYRTIQ